MLRSFLLFNMLSLVLFATAQNKFIDRIADVQLDSGSIQQLVQILEIQTGCYFYYDAADFDSVFITVSMENVALGKILDYALGVSFSYVTDSIGHIFITRGPPIRIEMESGTLFEVPPKIAKVDRGIKQPVTERPINASLDDHRLYIIGNSDDKKGNSVVAGYIRNAVSREGIGNATVVVEDVKLKTISDAYGYFVLKIPKGRHVIKVTSIGFSDARRQVEIKGDGQFPVDMLEYITPLRAVTIAGTKSANVTSTDMGMQPLAIKTVKQLPRLLGEADLVRVFTLLPGITTVGEGTTGLNVRGGATDQNLVLFDGATVFNPSHFFGFFSGFNADLVKDAELYKSHVPVSHGGRLSSVLEVLTREGDHSKITGMAGIGPLSSHVSIEGPLSKRMTFIGGARMTYSNWLLRSMTDYKRSKAGFYDANLKVTTELNEHNTFFISLYNSDDHFRLADDTTYRYGNLNVSGKWKHIFNNNLYASFAGGYDQYHFDMSSDFNPVNAYQFTDGINQLHFKASVYAVSGLNHRIESGISIIRYILHPGTMAPVEKSLTRYDNVPKEKASEAAVYINDEWTLMPKLTLNAGLRYSFFSRLGPATTYIYPNGISREVSSIIDTLLQSRGSIISYRGPEPRISVRWMITPVSSVKVAYNRTRQYLHQVTNTTVISPTDTWKLSDRYFQPALSDMISFGLYRNFRENTIEGSIETYYKWMQHLIGFKSGASLFLNHHLETETGNATGKAYGVEVLIKKTAGKLTGWISYAYSRTFVRVDDPLIILPINGGRYYPADYDKPHLANLVANYRFSHRFSGSWVSSYSTGRPITLPTARYYMDGSYRVFYGDRNADRVPDYFRTDLSFNIEGNHKLKKLGHSSWTVGIYNLFARRNPYSVYFSSEDGRIMGYKFSIFGTAIPALSYNVKF